VAIFVEKMAVVEGLNKTKCRDNPLGPKTVATVERLQL